MINIQNQYILVIIIYNKNYSIEKSKTWNFYLETSVESIHRELLLFYEKFCNKISNKGKNKNIIFFYTDNFSRCKIVNELNDNSLIICEFLKIKFEENLIENLRKKINIDKKYPNSNLKIFFDGGCSPPNQLVKIINKFFIS